MATLNDFRLRVSAKLGLDNTPSGDQPAIDGWVNEGVVQTLTRSRANVFPGTMDLAAGYGDYNLPTQILALDEMTIAPVDGSGPWEMERLSPAEIIQMRITTPGIAGPTRFYALNGSILLMVYPIPTAADVLNIYYVPRPALLVLPNDYPVDIPDEWHKIVEYYACWQAAEFTDSAPTQEGNLYQAQFEAELQKFRRAMLHRGGRRLSPASRRRRTRIGSPSQQQV